MILEANKKYFIHPPHIDKISFHVIPDSMTRFLILKSKKLDIGSLSAIEYEKKIDADFKKHFNIYETISLGYTYLGFNLRLKKIFGDFQIFGINSFNFKTANFFMFR